MTSMPSGVQMENWASLKRETTILEQYIRQRLQTLPSSIPLDTTKSSSSHPTSGPIPSSVVHNNQHTHDIETGTLIHDANIVRLREIDDAIHKFADVVDKLSIIATKQSQTTHSVVVNTYLNILQEVRQEYRKQVQQAKERKNEIELLNDAKVRYEQQQQNTYTSVTDILLRERSSLMNAHSEVDEALNRAAETQSMLSRQRSTILSSSSRLGSIMERIPGINQLMTFIHRKRIKNELVIATVIGLCVCFTLWYLFG